MRTPGWWGGAAGGDSLTGMAVMADEGGVIAVDPERPESDYVGSCLSFCGVDAPPVMFPDASTVVVR